MIRAWRPAASRPSSSSRSSLPAETRFTELELPEPTLSGDQVLIAVEGAVMGLAEATGNAETTPGGAAVGTIRESGEAAEGFVGKRVVVGPIMPCGDCDVCHSGRAELCPERLELGRDVDGALASHVVARARWLCPLEDGLEIVGPAAALLGREAVLAYGMYARASVAPGESVVVLGENTVARFLLEIAAARGGTPIAVIGEKTSWRGWLAERGIATVAIANGEAIEEVADRLEQALAGSSTRPRRVFETGSIRGAQSRRLAATFAGPAATVILSAGSCREAEPFTESLLRDGCTVIGVANAHPDLIPETAALAVRGELDLEAAAELVDLDQMSSVAAAIARGEVTTSVVVRVAR